MTKNEVQNLLAVGIDTVAVANSAKKAGYEIYAADYFGDIDLQRVCSASAAIIKQKRGKSCGRIESEFRPEAFLEMTESLLERNEVDATLLSSGLDDFFDVLRKLDDLIQILGNSPEVIEKVRKKPEFFEELESLGIAHPEAMIVNDVDEAKAAAAEIGYPIVIKPVRGFGGTGVRTAEDSKKIGRAFSEASSFNKHLLVQKFIKGVHASISFLAAGKKVKILTINEQLLGLPFLCQQEPFGYCGNIVPLHFANSIPETCKRITENISSHFGLKGSNGIDLVISEEDTPYVVEVNPRFQGTLECVEKILGINLVKSHIDACLHDSLPIVEEKTSSFCTRLILYAPERVVVPDLTVFREVKDIPLSGVLIEKGEPLCSIITEGKNREISFQKGAKIAESIYSMLYPA